MPLTSDVLSIAPMIDWTYSHFRVFMRLLAPNAVLYTEMQTTGAVLNNPKRALPFDAMEHPIVLQLGGSNPAALAECARMAQEAGYDEVNLNLGCPSDKVQAGQFGACLMSESARVAECISAIKKAVTIPVTAKTRIGIDHQDSYEFFSNFARCLVDAGSDKLIVHARKAWLNGLNPKQNRTIPPVNYDYVYRLKSELSHVPVIINGNISTITEVKDHLAVVDGVMLGRLACDNPYAIARIHHEIYSNLPLLKRSELMLHYLPYIEKQHQLGESLSLLIKPIFNLAHGMPGASQWKQYLMRAIQQKSTSGLSESVDRLLMLEEHAARVAAVDVS